MQIIWSGYRAVDTFFFVGGLLLTKGMLKKDFCIRKRQLKQGNRNTKMGDLSKVAVIKDTKEGVEDTGNKVLEELDNFTSAPEEEHTILRKELRLQGFMTSVVTFLSRYAYYLFHRIVR